MTITNVQGSTLSREATYTMLLKAGPEITVASTKAYTAQIAVQAVGEAKNVTCAKEFNLKQQLALVAEGMEQLVDGKEKVDELAKTRNAFYIGRGVDCSCTRRCS